MASQAKLEVLTQQLVASLTSQGGTAEELNTLTQCLKDLSRNSRSLISTLRIVLDRLEESIPCEPNLKSILTDRRLLTRITGFLAPSATFGVLPRVCRVLAADVKQFLGFLAPYYMSTEQSMKQFGMVKLVDLTVSHGSSSKHEMHHVESNNQHHHGRRGESNHWEEQDTFQEENNFDSDDLDSSDEDLDSTRDPNNPEASPGKMDPKLHLFKSEIECGVVLDDGKVAYSIFSDYFGRYVDVFTAVADPSKRQLFRASTLAAKLKCKTNKVGMYLARRREFQDDIYQATNFRRKPIGASGLKSGGYFISLNVSFCLGSVLRTYSFGAGL
jgi:hypothetical protein